MKSRHRQVQSSLYSFAMVIFPDTFLNVRNITVTSSEFFTLWMEHPLGAVEAVVEIGILPHQSPARFHHATKHNMSCSQVAARGPASLDGSFPGYPTSCSQAAAADSGLRRTTTWTAPSCSERRPAINRQHFIGGRSKQAHDAWRRKHLHITHMLTSQLGPTRKDRR